MRTYDEILSAMEMEYERLGGVTAAEASDIGIRLRLLAGEILSFENSLKWMERQSDPRTAQGEYLDKLAREKGLIRQTEVKSKGTLTFGRATALNYDLSIPAGTVCATEDNLWEYVTTEDVRLGAGTTVVTAPAEAVLGGRGSNCAAGVITVLAAAPEGVETVTNEKAFTGGKAAESDGLLRERLLLACRLIPGCGNRSFYISTAMAFEGVSSAGAWHDGNGLVTVSIYCADGAPGSELISKIQKALNEVCPVNVTVKVEAATEVSTGVSVRIKQKSGYSLEEAKQEAETAIADYFASLGVGDSFYAAKVCGAVMNCSSVANCLVNGSDVVGAQGSIVLPGNITVWEMAE